MDDFNCLVVRVGFGQIQIQVNTHTVKGLLSTAKHMFKWCENNMADTKERREKARRVNDIHCLLCLGLPLPGMEREDPKTTINGLFMDAMEGRRQVDDVLSREIVDIINRSQAAPAQDVINTEHRNTWGPR